MIKILHLQTELNLACGVTRTISQITNNSSEEFEHHIIALGGDGISRFQSSNVKVVIINKYKKSFLNTIFILNQIFFYIKDNSINILHSHHRYFDALGFLLNRFLGVKTITSVQSKVYGLKYLSYKSEILIACSDYIKSHLKKNFKVSENKILVIYNSVNQYEIKITIDKMTLLNDLNINVNKKVIGFVGRFDFCEKGIDILLKAISLVNKKRNDIHLILVGEGANRLEIEKFVSVENIPCSVVSKKENIFNYINLFDLFVLPSRVEPFGIVIVEAGVMRKPVIASDVDGIPEIVEHEKTGILFEKENINQLTYDILRILDNPQFAERIAKNLQTKVNNNFLSSKMVSLYQEAYKNLLGSNVIQKYNN